MLKEILALIFLQTIIKVSSLNNLKSDHSHEHDAYNNERNIKIEEEALKSECDSMKGDFYCEKCCQDRIDVKNYEQSYAAYKEMRRKIVLQKYSNDNSN